MPIFISYTKNSCYTYIYYFFPVVILSLVLIYGILVNNVKSLLVCLEISREDVVSERL